MVTRFRSQKHYNKLAIKLLIFKKFYDEITKDSGITDTKDFMQHGSTTRLLHSVAVSYYSYRLALLLGMDDNIKDLVLGALTHDYFLYDSKDGDASRKGHGVNHPHIALENAEKEFQLSDIEKDIIVKHMFPVTFVPPKYKETVIVCLIDKACAVYEFFKHKNPYGLLNREILENTDVRKAMIPLLETIE